MCVYCEDVQFCEKCFLLLKAGMLPVNVCGPRHKWLVVPPRPEHVRNRNQEHRSMIYVGGDWLSITDFKLHLKGGTRAVRDNEVCSIVKTNVKILEELVLIQCRKLQL